ncbi:MAG TPA: ferrochelatase [Streptosporangiaceae bacterium]|jgi:ferrochelatase|nr:ferrochelatase [Streptosporangiaceae bacterium]
MAKEAAFLLVSFGGPEGPDDVMPFLRNVTAGRNVPDERLAHVAEHYFAFGGVSPINAQNRELLGAIERAFTADGIDLPVYWGNRNWPPLLTDTMQAMADDGVRSVIAFATAAYSSYSSCRQYLEDIDRARVAVGANAPAVVKIPPYYGHAGFAAAFIDATARALASLPAETVDEAELVFTAHSIPESMAAASGPDGHAYQAQLTEVAGRVAAGIGRTTWQLAYQSRSGPPSAPWLGPDINECLTTLAKAGAPAVVVVPIGFVSDHMEVVFDLDVEAARTAADLGLPMARAATPGMDPHFVALICSLVSDFAAGTRGDGLAGSWSRALGPSVARLCGERCCRIAS